MEENKAKPAELEDGEIYYIDTSYKVVRFSFPVVNDRTEFPYLPFHTKSKRAELLAVIKKFEDEMKKALALNSDQIGANAQEQLARDVIKLAVPELPFDVLAEDERVGVGILQMLGRDLRSFFLTSGGTPGSKLLQNRQSQMLSMLEKSNSSNTSTD